MKSEKIQRTSVVTEAMHRIKDLISSEKYQIGDKIPTEVALAERFGIGRSSIREAIKVFQYLGILEARVPKGTFICESSNIASEFLTWFALLEQKDINEILEIREVFEQKGVYNLIAKFQTAPDEAASVISLLEEQVQIMQIAVQKQEYDEIINADFYFHKILIQQTENRLFLAIYNVLHRFTQDEMQTTYVNYDDLNELMEDHDVIINAIKSGDHQTAISTHARHFPLIREYLIKTNSP